MTMTDVLYRFGSVGLDVDRLHTWLAASYWAGQRSREQIERSLRHSFCISAWDGTTMVGFARLITDFATHAYLCDVIVDPAAHGQGVGRGLVSRLVGHEAVATCLIQLLTRDAHGVYRPLGFVDRPAMLKPRRRPDG